MFVSSFFSLIGVEKYHIWTCPYMVFLLIDFHACNNLFNIENMRNPSFLL